MSKKQIGIVGPIGNNIPPKKQGAIEWLVHELAEGLVEKGHPVTLFAPKTAQTSANLVPTAPKPMIDYSPSQQEKSRKLRIELSLLANTREEIIKHKDDLAVLFDHTVNGGLFSDLEKLTGIPTYHTIHLPLYKELADIFKKNNSRVITISNNQRGNFTDLNYAGTIYDAVKLDKFNFIEEPEDYFIFAGKLTPAKNPLAAIKAAKRAKVKLKLIGRISDEEYFEKKIKPALDKKREYLGEVSRKKAIDLYSKAKSFLFPTSWPEPFGLVMIEAMACGTPIIAFNYGATSEIIKDGETGFIVKNEKQMAKAIDKINTISRKKCRRNVEENFSIEKMIDGYEKIYQNLK